MTKEEKIKEDWVDIKGYEGLYMISKLGNIKSLSRCIIKKTSINKGYEQVNLCKEGKIKTFQIHKLMAINFLGHTPNGHNEVVDHIDGNKLNNKINNLQLISQRSNTVKSKKNKLTGATFIKKSGKWMSRIRKGKKYIHLGVFETDIEAHEEYKKALK